MTSTMATSPDLPLMPESTIHVPSKPTKKKSSLKSAKEQAPLTPEETLKKKLAESKKKTKSKDDERLGLARVPALERKKIVALKGEKTRLYIQFNEQDKMIASEREQRAALSKEYDELARQLEVAKRNLGGWGDEVGAAGE